MLTGKAFSKVTATEFLELIAHGSQQELAYFHSITTNQGPQAFTTAWDNLGASEGENYHCG